MNQPESQIFKADSRQQVGLLGKFFPILETFAFLWLSPPENFYYVPVSRFSICALSAVSPILNIPGILES